MDEQKKLNKSKFYNKNKYKNPKYAQKSKPVVSVASKSVPLLKNWDRYDEEEGGEEPVPVSSKDYGIISSRPISQATSFHFKKDKYFLPDTEQKQSIDDIFKIDLNLLSLGLDTIPFHERFDIDAKYFKDHELSAMQSKADKAATIYESALKNKFSNSSNRLIEASMDAPITEETGKPSPTPSSSSSSIESLHEEKPNLNKDAAVQDLEDWLDDILK